MATPLRHRRILARRTACRRSAASAAKRRKPATILPDAPCSTAHGAASPTRPSPHRAVAPPSQSQPDLDLNLAHRDLAGDLSDAHLLLERGSPPSGRRALLGDRFRRVRRLAPLRLCRHTQPLLRHLSLRIHFMKPRVKPRALSAPLVLSPFRAGLGRSARRRKSSRSSARAFSSTADSCSTIFDPCNSNARASTCSASAAFSSAAAAMSAQHDCVRRAPRATELESAEIASWASARHAPRLRLAPVAIGCFRHRGELSLESSQRRSSRRCIIACS